MCELESHLIRRQGLGPARARTQARCSSNSQGLVNFETALKRQGDRGIHGPTSRLLVALEMIAVRCSRGDLRVGIALTGSNSYEAAFRVPSDLPGVRRKRRVSALGKAFEAIGQFSPLRAVLRKLRNQQRERFYLASRRQRADVNRVKT